MSAICYAGRAKIIYSRRLLERSTIAGDSPVDEIYVFNDVVFLSRAGHVKSRLNLGRLWSKAKYK